MVSRTLDLEAVALLDSFVDVTEPDIAEDRRRLDAFNRNGEAVPLDAVKAWVASQGSDDERPPPLAKKRARSGLRPMRHGREIQR